MEVVETCGEGTLSSAKPSNILSITSIYDDDEVVGFEKDSAFIMKKLTQGKERDVISIYGMPGLGKTTLARKVYCNPDIVYHFDVKAWCAVSQAYNRRMLLTEIFKQVTNADSEIEEDDIIADMLRKSLIGKRYLIVLDDIWDVEAWEDLEKCFPQGEYGSKVMVTTRIEQVAKQLQHHGDPYYLTFLEPEESWKLLEKKVFRRESCPPDLQEAGLQVATHCKGLPLVVVLVAGIIAKMERKASLWLDVANDLSSIALGEQSMKVIQSSYDHLEDHLKCCLLYMGLFPEDHKIPVDDLLKLWMAEEFVLNAERENMEEASLICLSDLLNRSLIMVSGMRINRDVEYCSLHDVVREFCLRKLTEVTYMHSMESRLCIYIHDDLVKQLDHSEYKLDRIPMLNFTETNSLEFIVHPKYNAWNNQYSNPLDLLVKLRFVRALHLMDVELPNSWATAMESLTQLRYLALFVKHFELKWISHLHHLQTLQLKSYKKLHLKAATLWEMKKLRHMNIDSFSVVWEDINDEGKCSTTMLKNMKTIHTCNILLDNRNPRFWWRFPNLEELSFCINGLPSCSLFPLQQVHTRLHSLFVQLPDHIFWNTYGWESYFVFPPNLRHLCLTGCFLTEEMVLNIARLKKLETLRLEMGFRWTRRGGYCWDITNVEFPALKYLTLFSMQIVEWKASDDSFPVLEELSIESAQYFKEIPPSFADIPTLRLIQLTNCIDSLGVSAMNIKRHMDEMAGNDRLQVVIKRI
ncbi:putative late blight resistance protein homolog R1B-12 [Solanum stenotomum]|uniref:putative late blight resistance protein homolog R1B-12 n=1 Tax=Solanum stenotomum TaxID=172797 RepID=UPI0020D13608|nr:putative late blight resistance protein homolog R1B-12 [Solanum stenotomum]